MTLIVTFDLLSKNFNMAPNFYRKRQGYHIWHEHYIKQEDSVMEQVTFYLHF